jgi:mono/diheme cytochrome c family protein
MTTRYPWLFFVFVASAALVAAISAAPAAQQSSAPPPRAGSGTTAAQTPARALVGTYCVSCHNQRAKTANLTLDTVDADHVSNSAEVWEKVVVKLRSRSMPPPFARRPDNETYDRVASWLETELDRAAAVHPNPGHPGELHRLNRIEYGNAIRDLLAVEIDAKAMLPADEQAYGFSTNADALSIQPALLDRYLAAAAKIARLAVGDPSIPPGFERYTALEGNSNETTWLSQNERLGEEFPLGTRGGIVARHYFPVDGEYVFKIRLDRTDTGVIRGLQWRNDIDIRVDDARVGQLSVGGTQEFSGAVTVANGGYVNATSPLSTADDRLEVRAPIKAGMRQVIATLLKTDSVAIEGFGPDLLPIWSREHTNKADNALMISALLVGGPYAGRVSPESPSRQRLFICQPKTSRDETPCATRILTTLARRAYRRSPTDDDVKTIVDFYEAARARGGDFDAGIRAGIERVLVSPDFLFRIEADPDGVSAGTAYNLPDLELASRLSFFLWSSIPDESLLDAALRGRLHEPAVLEHETRRMLADPRARTALVQNFFAEWLQTRNVWLLTPDLNQKFPWFDDNLRVAFVREMELFLDAQLKEDRGIVDLLTSDQTFLNQQLAQHYGIPGVYGSHFRRVTLTDDNRFGLLGKAAVLSVTSYSTRTAPTIRGKYLLENILAAPPPPPPPNVPALDDSKDGRPRPVREMLEMHRRDPVCASCHARMDPLGLSLENFDAIGRWRTTDAGAPIDASGVLLDGTKVDGPAALRRALVAQKEQFVRTVTAKLLTYATGRGLEYYDAPAIRGIVRASAPDDYRWSSTIVALVKSAPFRMRRAGS